jgi:hypothetical protein
MCVVDYVRQVGQPYIHTHTIERTGYLSSRVSFDELFEMPRKEADNDSL